MMERPLKSLALLGMLVVAAAERDLLALRLGAPGNLHAIAFTPSNYWQSNGNGTFTTTAYSPNSAPNSAFLAASGYQGAATNIPTTTGTVVGSFLGLYGGSGLTSVAFPSRSFAVAVGVANAPTPGNPAQPSIMVTIDAGATWLAASGTPQAMFTLANGASNPPTTGTAAYPAITPGDLQKVICLSRSTCWAVGSSIAFPESRVIVTPGSGAPDTYAAPDAAGASMPIIYFTTNGGTVWGQVNNLFYTSAQANAVVASGDSAALAKLYATVIPGGLYSIAADSAGRNLYAVGAPGSTYDNTNNNYVAQVFPTILYSGNGGASWVSQTTPVAVSGVTYTLLDVAVARRSVAFAVGGTTVSGTYDASIATAPANGAGSGGIVSGCSLQYGSSGGCNGQILITANAGISWKSAVYPGIGGKDAPAFTSIAINGNMVWVGGFVRQDKHYPLPPVTTGTALANGQSYNVLISMDGVRFVGATSFATFPAGFVLSAASDPPTAAYSPATASANLGLDANVNDVTGITWDNSVRGFIYGNGFILGTRDGGRNWVYETPNTIAVNKGVTVSNQLTSAGLVKTLANVPTSY